MTREEAITVLEESKRQNEVMRDSPTTFWASHQMAEGVKNSEKRIAAIDVALDALRPVSREQVERMRSRWITVVEVNGEQYSKCAACQMGLDGLGDAYLFCPHCGAPMTYEAAEMVIARLEALKDGKGD